MAKGHYQESAKAKRCRFELWKETKGRCEICRKIARIMHHIDGDQNNHDRDNIAAVCDRCHRIIHTNGKGYRGSFYRKKYGCSAQDIADKLNIKRAKVYNLCFAGRLDECIRAGSVVRKIHKSLYRGMYGFTIKQIIEKTGISMATILNEHNNGTLMAHLAKVEGFELVQSYQI